MVRFSNTQLDVHWNVQQPLGVFVVATRSTCSHPEAPKGSRQLLTGSRHLLHPLQSGTPSSLFLAFLGAVGFLIPTVFITTTHQICPTLKPVRQFASSN